MERAYFDIEQRDLEAILERTRDIWRGLASARIFLTGGTGFFGTWLLGTFLWARERLDLDLRIDVLSRDPEAFVRAHPRIAGERAVAFVRGDAATFAFPAGTFSHVVHAATDTTLAAHRRRSDHLMAIVGGTQRVLDFASAAGASNLLFASSGAVYGAQPPDLATIPETYRGAPLTDDLANTYGSAKRYAETLCSVHAAESGMRVKIARGFAFVGPHLPLDGHFAIGNFIRDARSNEHATIMINGDGTPVRSYLYAADLAAWLWTILAQPAPSAIYNVGSDDAVSVRDLAGIVAAAIAPEKRVVCQSTDAVGIAGNRYVPNIDRARSECGLDVWTPLPEAIRRTSSWDAHRTA